MDHDRTSNSDRSTSKRPRASSTTIRRGRTYWKVALILTVITVVEVWVYYIPSFVASRGFVPVLLIMSAIKFAIVCVFYMHLKYDHKLFRSLFAGPLIIAIMTLFALLFLFGQLHGWASQVMTMCCSLCCTRSRQLSVDAVGRSIRAPSSASRRSAHSTSGASQARAVGRLAVRGSRSSRSSAVSS